MILEQQIKRLLELKVFESARVRIMPECYAGASYVIGFTVDLGDKIIPNIVGVDIGCGMFAMELGKIDIDFAKLVGRIINERWLMRFSKLKELFCYRKLKDIKAIERATGSLVAEAKNWLRN